LTSRDDTDVAPPIHVSSTFDTADPDQRVYRRYTDATTERFEAVVGALEGGTAVAYSSGMAAVSAVLRALGPQRISLPDDVYHGVRHLVGLGVTDGAWAEAPVDALQAGDVHWVETPSNPRLDITDIAAAVTGAQRRGVRVVVDSTFATPVLQRPLELGADVVVHSATKFIAGHSDALAGVAVTADTGLAETLRTRRRYEGATPGSLDVWLALRGIRTLPLRIERQSASALRVAEHLAGRIPVVWYPWLAGHDGHDIARRQMTAGGGVLSFALEDGVTASAAVAGLAMFRNATSLGGVESLAEWRRSVDPDAPEGLIRLSIGLEAPTDLIADLDRVLDSAGV
jgi:cystathionine gamma-synthase